jgi:oxygen-dependent protoporphyrinogen oxidase
VAHPLDGFGLLVPEVECRRILGCLFPSTLFPGRAPAGHVLLTSFVGGTRQPELVEEQDDAALARMVQEELAALLGVHGEPVITHISRWPQAIPQYELGHRTRLAQLAALESAHPGLQFAGNYRGGISVSDRLLAALDALPA